MASAHIEVVMMKLMRPWIGTCEETTACLSDHLDGELGQREERRVRRHLAWCRRCQVVYDSLARAVEGVRGLGRLELEDPSPSVADAVLERIRHERA